MLKLDRCSECGHVAHEANGCGHWPLACGCVSMWTTAQANAQLRNDDTVMELDALAVRATTTAHGHRLDAADVRALAAALADAAGALEECDDADACGAHRTAAVVAADAALRAHADAT